MLQTKRFAELSKTMPTKIEKAVEVGIPMSVMKQVADVQAFIEFELIKLSTLVNVDQRLNIQRNQVEFIAQSICDVFPTESMEDIALCFKRGAMGLYGEIYRLDGAVIVGWIQQYLDEKYAVVENKLMGERDNFYNTKPPETTVAPNPDRNLLSLLKTVVGPVEPQDDTNRKENEYQRQKLVYTPPTEEEIEKRRLHLEWIKANHDPRTGKPLPTFVDEIEWLKTNSK